MHYRELGGTLFVPAIHKDLKKILLYGKYKELKSIVIDFEDSLAQKDLTNALDILVDILRVYVKNFFYLFIRPRDVYFLEHLLKIKNIDKIDGFVIPKFSLDNAKLYSDIFTKNKFYWMPSIEGKELFYPQKLQELHNILLQHKERIVLVRFGLEDMLRQLKMKRSCDFSIFDYSAPQALLGIFIAMFKSSGFAISGGVYPYFENTEGFIQDLQRDLREGLFSKTIIHPNQIRLVNELYKVDLEELEWAKRVFKSDENVFAHQKSMVESLTMLPYAREIIERAKFYGVKSSV